MTDWIIINGCIYARSVSERVEVEYSLKRFDDENCGSK